MAVTCAKTNSIGSSPNGKRLLEIASPQVHEGTSNSMKTGFGDCHFDESGKLLWLSAPLSAEDCEIRLIESETGSLVEKTVIADPFGGSDCSFHNTERPDLISLWLAAGQDGQQVYWLKQGHNGFSCTLEPALANTTPPAFSPSGSQFLVTNEERGLCKYDYSAMQMVGLPLVSEDEDNPFAESLAFLNERLALAGTNEGRIFTVDTDRMTIEEEVALEDHEPRAIGDYYPTLAKEKGLATDISWFTKLGDVIVFIYRRDRGKGLTGWKDTLLFYSVEKQKRGSDGKGSLQ